MVNISALSAARAEADGEQRHWRRRPASYGTKAAPPWSDTLFVPITRDGTGTGGTAAAGRVGPGYRRSVSITTVTNVSPLDHQRAGPSRRPASVDLLGVGGSLWRRVWDASPVEKEVGLAGDHLVLGDRRHTGVVKPPPA